MPDIGFRPVTNLENFSILARMGIIVTDTANAPGRSQKLRSWWVAWALGVNIGSAGFHKGQEKTTRAEEKETGKQLVLACLPSFPSPFLLSSPRLAQ
jgi:hypothetical protein